MKTPNNKHKTESHVLDSLTISFSSLTYLASFTVHNTTNNYTTQSTQSHKHSLLYIHAVTIGYSKNAGNNTDHRSFLQSCMSSEKVPQAMHKASGNKVIKLPSRLESQVIVYIDDHRPGLFKFIFKDIVPSTI